MAKKILEKKAKWFNLSETVEAIRNEVLELKEGGTEGPAGPEGPTGPEGPVGPAGEDGKDGNNGAKGDPGADGSDGFPTEAQWNDLVQRVENLENNPPA